MSTRFWHCGRVNRWYDAPSNPINIMKKTLFSLIATLTFSLFAANPGGVIDPAKAGPDFKIQGEYAGEDMGVQVIALGEG